MASTFGGRRTPDIGNCCRQTRARLCTLAVLCRVTAAQVREGHARGDEPSLDPGVRDGIGSKWSSDQADTARVLLYPILIHGQFFRDELCRIWDRTTPALVLVRGIYTRLFDIRPLPAR